MVEPNSAETSAAAPLADPYPIHEYKIESLRPAVAPERMWQINDPSDVYEFWIGAVTKAAWYDHERECVVALVLNAKNRVRGFYLISIGTVDSASVHPRDVFRTAIMAGAHSVILIHNHPSGEAVPSQADRKITRRLHQIGSVLEVELKDHVIIGHERFYSFNEAGLLESIAPLF